MSFNLKARVISQILDLFGFATRTTTDKQEDLLKKIKSFIGKKLSTNDIQRNNSLDRRIKKPNGE